MTDLWSFLLQTLTASGAAGLLLLVKALFRDKLSPRWQFGVWGVLALALLLPAGRGGRYALFNWPLWLETVKTALTGDYALTRVAAPVPLALRPPGDPAGLLFDLYVLGAVVLLGRCALSYLRLRLALRRGRPADPAQVERVAAEYGLKPCPAVAVPGLPSAFVCGVFRPVLALPAETAVDDKVVLHELLHLKYRDAAWGLLICLFRCLHWCNPLLWYCADRAGNDAEALCDQRVLERLAGEARRDYGRILLSMAGGKYARAPGTSSMANGARNIRERVQAIARFRRYPAGMALASVCVAVVLALPLVLGEVQALAPASLGAGEEWRFHTAMASARVTRCTTPAGALDAYGKAVLGQNGIYRALCAPLDYHPSLAAGMEAAAHGPEARVHQHWDPGLPGEPNAQAGYSVYNLSPEGAGWRALMVFPLLWVHDPGGGPPLYPDSLWVAAQAIRAEERDGRWVVEPLEDFWTAETGHAAGDAGWLSWGDDALPPAAVYAADLEPLRLEVAYQTTHRVDNAVRTRTDMSWFFGPATSFDLVPKPDARFQSANESYFFRALFTGGGEARGALGRVTYAAVPLSADGSHPELRYGGGDGGSSSTGAFWGRSGQVLPGDDVILSDGGGSGSNFDPNARPEWPAAYLVELTMGGASRRVTLYPVEGGAE